MKTLIIALVALLAWPVYAQEDAMKDLPGYVDFGQLNSLFGEPSVQIAVGESLLGMVSAISANEDPEVAALFNRLKGVRVNVFETASLDESAVDHVKNVSSKLSDMGWESVVTVNSADEQVRIFMKISNNMVEGITVMAVEDQESVFINVIGNINPAELGRVMDNFDISFENGGSQGGSANESEE